MTGPARSILRLKSYIYWRTTTGESAKMCSVKLDPQKIGIYIQYPRRYKRYINVSSVSFQVEKLQYYIFPMKKKMLKENPVRKFHDGLSVATICPICIHVCNLIKICHFWRTLCHGELSIQMDVIAQKNGSCKWNYGFHGNLMSHDKFLNRITGFKSN